MTSREEAYKNMLALGNNPYPGRGIVIGVSEDGQHLVHINWIMGRSENSRNRIFSADGGRVYTEPADPSKLKDPSLIIYNAMNEREDAFVVSNGDQTDTVILKHWDHGLRFNECLEGREYEPDAPNYTPRITGFSSLNPKGGAVAELSILRKSLWGPGCDRSLYQYENFAYGFGYCVTTYLGDAPEGEPLPSFRGEPLLMPLDFGSIQRTAAVYWTRLNEANRVALAVKFISRISGESKVWIENKYQKVEMAG